MLGRLSRSRLHPRCAAVLALATLVNLVALGGCTESADEEIETRFGARRAAGVEVLNHAGSGPGMDHSDVWELAPVDDAFLTEVVRAAELRRRTDGEPLLSGLSSTSWPAWWDAARIETLPEAYGRDDANRHWRVWVDRTAGRMYLQWFST